MAETVFLFMVAGVVFHFLLFHSPVSVVQASSALAIGISDSNVMKTDFPCSFGFIYEIFGRGFIDGLTFLKITESIKVSTSLKLKMCPCGL
jgi:hypothetical protein